LESVASHNIAGFDWGARTANIMVLWPERCKGIAAVSGCLIGIAKPIGSR